MKSKNLKERIEEFKYFKNYFGKSQCLCKEIQGRISMQKYEMQIDLERYTFSKSPDAS